MNPLIAVIADDLTGVCDTGAQFAVAGLRTVGSVGLEIYPGAVPEVVLVNTQSRSLKEAEAARSISLAVSALKPLQPRWFFKKIDTALRGNIGVEILALLNRLDLQAALCISSIPGAGRTTVAGIQYFNGKPIKESIHGEDRFNPNPVWTSSLIELFSKIPGLDIEHISLDEVRSGPLDTLSRVGGEKRKVLLFDSETDEDIDRIVRASINLPPSSFFYVGSFGLSKSLGRYLFESFPDVRDQVNPLLADTVPRHGKGVLIISGSSHPMAQCQMGWAEKAEQVKVVRIPPQDLLERLPELTRETIRVLHGSVMADAKIGIGIGEGKPGVIGRSREIVEALGKMAVHLLQAFDWKALVLIGGDTGYAVCRAAGIRHIEIAGNISFVAAYGRPRGSMKPPDVLVTKGGSLGEEDTLAKILEFVDRL